jgi:hypothetical protein
MARWSERYRVAGKAARQRQRPSHNAEADEPSAPIMTVGDERRGDEVKRKASCSLLVPYTRSRLD